MKKFFKEEKKKQNLALALIGLVVVGSYLLLPEILEGEKKKQEVPKVKIFDDKKEEEESFKALYGEKLKNLEVEVETRIKKLEEENKKLKEKIKELKENPPQKVIQVPKESENKDEKKQVDVALKTNTAKDYYSDLLIPPPPKPQKVISLNPKEIVSDVGSDVTGGKKVSKIVVKVEDPDNLLDVSSFKEPKKVKVKKKKKEKPSYKILPGSFVKARILNGFNAYTGMSRTGKPSPVLLVITDKVQLPNDYTLDLRGCFLKGAATGDLSSRRAKIRIEELSCIRDDGKAIVRKVSGSVNGPDGQEGVLGKVVYKQTEVLRNSAIAGALEGISKVMQMQASTLVVSPQGIATGIKPSQAFSASMFGGAESMAKTLSRFYGKILDLTFPVIDVPAGVPVEVLFLTTVDLSDGGEK